jgi:hypothetical protein
MVHSPEAPESKTIASLKSKITARIISLSWQDSRAVLAAAAAAAPVVNLNFKRFSTMDQIPSLNCLDNAAKESPAVAKVPKWM